MFVSSINVKFLLNLICDITSRCTILPQLWLNNLFKIPLSSNNVNQQYFHTFLKEKINILDCKFKVHIRNAWNGHPFYFDVLKSVEKLSSNLPIKATNNLGLSWAKLRTKLAY